MRRVLLLGALFSAIGAVPLSAAPLTINFCPGSSTCPAGVIEASLTFTDIVNSDPNDYLLDIVITGNSSAPAYVDEVSFSIDGVQTPGGYEFQPTLLSAPLGGAPWIVYWDNISGSTTSCTSNTTNSQSVCSQSGPGDAFNFGAPLTGQSLHWQYLVDLTGTTPLAAGNIVNLRAQFLDSNGTNVGTLSPDGGQLPVPEPSSLILAGVGLGMAALRRRRSGL